MRVRGRVSKADKVEGEGEGRSERMCERRPKRVKGFVSTPYN